MHTWLRITLLAVCTAAGVGVAMAVAIQKPSEPKSTAREAARAPDWPAAPFKPVVAAPAEPVLAPYRDRVAQQVDQLEDTIQQLEESSHRRQRSMLQAIEAIQDRIEQPFGGQQTVATQPPPVPPPALDALPAPQTATSGRGLEGQAEARQDVRRTEGDDTLSISIQNTDLRAVLETISRETGLNIIASKNVTGVVTANLNGVDIETALSAILKSTGYVAAREGNIIYVGAPTDLAMMNQSQERIETRIYRPNYVKAADLQALFTPLISMDGKLTVSAPSQIDIPADQVKTGGNSFAGAETLIVRDYETVLAQLDEIFAEVDVKPSQVAIEAMILSVKLSDTYKFGVNFSALRDRANTRVVSGTPGTSLGSVNVTDGGLQFGFLDASLGMFIDCLEEIGDTNVIASPRLTCLNKQRAEIQIGEELGYVSTTVTESSSTQTINFLSVGTLLRIRPFIGTDGLIRLEVHPELSTGSVDVQQGLSLPQKAVTQVTTNVLCPDGCTVVIGGLIREDLITNTSQIPLIGNVPYVGWLFRQKDQQIDRNEIIVLITPRIVSEPFMTEEGMKLGNDFTQRQGIYFNKMSPIGKRNLGQHHLRLARAAYNAGDPLSAMKQVNLAIHYDPQSRDAVVLRNEIVAAGGFEDESIHEYLHLGLGPLSSRGPNYSRRGSPWKESEGFGPAPPTATGDQGVAGPTRTILKPMPRGHNPFNPSGPPVLGNRGENAEVVPTPQVETAGEQAR
jgi:type IV pilus assembly protein PilQ